MAQSSELPTLELSVLHAISGGMRYSSTDCESKNVEDRRPGASTTAPPKECTTSINPDVKLPPQQPLPLPTWPAPR